MRIVTHNGHFHADELLAVAALLLKYPGAEVVRSRDKEVVEAADIVVDVGHIYDSAKMRFDHHQPQSAGKRANGIPYASSGLIWKHFGEEIAGGKEEAQLIDELIIVPVDSEDNGVTFSSSIVPGLKEYSLGDFFESFAKGARTPESSEKAFFEALENAQALLTREIKAAKQKVSDWNAVREIYDKSSDKRIIVLPTYLSSSKVLIPSDALFVVYPRTNREWGASGVLKFPRTFERKKLFPESWAGLEGENLAKVSGVPDAIFCHRHRHLVGAKSQEGAIKLANLALNA